MYKMEGTRINKLKNIFLKFENSNELLAKKDIFLINIGAKSKIFEFSTYGNLKSIFTISNMKFLRLLPNIKYIFAKRESMIKQQYYLNNLIKIVFHNSLINIYPEKLSFLRNTTYKYVFLFKTTFIFTNYSELVSSTSLFYF
mmetsp:Transcript_6067/g.8363  ORF Transcript_6067/g.8363 Transcript_6067/m.8363 type:complete len:142 (+) Transcript_6067:8632-9057(+)